MADAPDRLALQTMLPASDKLSIVRAAVGNHIRMIPIGDVIYFESLDNTSTW